MRYLVYPAILSCVKCPPLGPDWDLDEGSLVMAGHDFCESDAEDLREAATTKKHVARCVTSQY